MGKHRHRLRYSLRALLVATVLFAIWFAVVANRAATQRRVVNEIGGLVIYRHEIIPASAGGAPVDRERVPNWPDWIQSLLGADYFRTVYLAYVSGTDELRQLAFLRDVEVVNLEADDVTDEGLLPLLQMPKLRVVVISNGHQLTNEGVARLAEIRRLTELYLDNVPIDDAALSHFEQRDQLEQITFANTLVTQEGVESLKSALPSTEVSFRGFYDSTKRSGESTIIGYTIEDDLPTSWASQGGDE